MGRIGGPSFAPSGKGAAGGVPRRRRAPRVGFVWLCLLPLAAASPGKAPPEPISMKGLLSEMTDLARMAEFPDPPYTCRQFSSYERASKSPAENWFANADRGQYLRVEDNKGRREYVMMDAKGPGAIVRIWTTNTEGTTLRIYIDGAAAPALEGSMTKLLDGSTPRLPRPIAGLYSRGWNLYLPIPYAKSCKVTASDGNWKEFYYHVNYRTYPPGTPVTSFRKDQLDSLATQIRGVADKLEKPSTLRTAGIGEKETKSGDIAIPPGEEVPLGSFTGPRAVCGFTVRWTPSSNRDEPALRAVVLSMKFDGEETVQAPLGDFFGSAPGINPFDSPPLGVVKGGEMTCRWVMPFRSSAEIRAKNHGNARVSFKSEISTMPYKWTDATMLFHAKWRIGHGIPTEPKKDWNYMTAKGKGVFAGAALAIDNPVIQWWGEGDEKIYVDGETFPSHFGTGTEDYFGYAWGDITLFTHAYHAQPRADGPNNIGRTSLNRFHILDRIPFTKDFKFDMELWHWKDCKVNMSVVDYWYARPGATDGIPPIRPDDVVLRPVPK